MAYVQTDETGRIVATTGEEEYAEGFEEFDLPDDFDYLHQSDYRIEDGELVHDPRQKTAEELAAEESMRRHAQIRAAVPMLARAMSASLTDAQLLEIPLLFDEWEAGREYAADDVIRYGGELYRVAQAHTSQSQWEPGAEGTKSLYTHITIDPETGVEEWRRPTGAHDAYNTGDRVLYNGVVYQSTIDGNTWSPDEYQQGWEEVRE